MSNPPNGYGCLNICIYLSIKIKKLKLHLMNNLLHSFIYLLKRGMFTIISLISPFKRNKITRIQFEREDDGLWYVVLPSWKGPKANLLMVGGTEAVLDSILKDERRFGFKYANVVNIEVTTTPDLLKGAYEFRLVEKCQWDGAYYLHTRSKKQVWFCDVLKYVMGEFPKTMYYRHVIGAI